MSLVLATLVAGIFLLILGLALILYPAPVRNALTAFPRSRTAAFVLLVAATGLVLFNVSKLGEADFGKYKNILFAFFLMLSIGAWFRVPDFLGIRALSVLGLILAGQFLAAAYLQLPTTRLFLVVFSYVIVLLSLYLAASPYRFRDAVARFNSSNGIRQITGGSLAVYGIILCVMPLTY